MVQIGSFSNTFLKGAKRAGNLHSVHCVHSSSTMCRPVATQYGITPRQLGQSRAVSGIWAAQKGHAAVGSGSSS